MAQQSTSKAKMLLTKNKISEEAAAVSLVGGSAILADTTYSLPVYDEEGTLLGYIALFDTPTLL